MACLSFPLLKNRNSHGREGSAGESGMCLTQSKGSVNLRSQSGNSENTPEPGGIPTIDFLYQKEQSVPFSKDYGKQEGAGPHCMMMPCKCPQRAIRGHQCIGPKGMTWSLSCGAVWLVLALSVTS